MSNESAVPALAERQPGRRRQYTAEQKRALLDECTRAGNSVSTVGRRDGIAPSLLFHWKRVMDEASKKGLKANERVVPESEVKQLRARIRELERLLGKKTMEVEILQEAVSIARETSGSRAAASWARTVASEADRHRA